MAGKEKKLDFKAPVGKAFEEHKKASQYQWQYTVLNQVAVLQDAVHQEGDGQQVP